MNIVFLSIFAHAQNDDQSVNYTPISYCICTKLRTVVKCDYWFDVILKHTKDEEQWNKSYDEMWKTNGYINDWIYKHCQNECI